MRILVVNNFFPPRVGGSAHIADALARHYAAAGHEVMVLTTGYGGALPLERRDGLTIVRLPSWTLPESRLSFNFDITFALKGRNLPHVFRLLDRFRPDVIHQHGQFFDLTWQTGLWARRRGVPTVLTVHTRLESPGRVTAAAFRGLDAGVVDPILRFLRPARVIAIDEFFVEYFRDRYHFDERQVVQIPIGIELDRFRHIEPTDVRKRFGLGPGPLALSLGHVIPLRNRVALIEALPAVLERHPSFKILMIGGVYSWQFLQLANRLRVMHALVLPGPLPKDEIPGICAGVDFEIHDLQGYGVGISTLEAMAAGTPAIVAIRDDLWGRDLPLSDGDPFVMVPVGDVPAVARQMSRLIEDPTWGAKVGERGRRFVFANFDMDRVSERNLQVLLEVARQRTGDDHR